MSHGGGMKHEASDEELLARIERWRKVLEEMIRLRLSIAKAAQALIEEDPEEAYHQLYWADEGKSRGEHLKEWLNYEQS